MSAPTVSPSAVLAGRWEVDPAHTTVEFRVRHAGLARVRGTFTDYDGVLEVGADGTMRGHGSAVAASLSTGIDARDEHLRSSDFFDVEHHPRLTLSTTSIEQDGDEIVVRADLSIRGISRGIELRGELLGTGRDDEGAERVGLSLAGRLDRRDFGLTWNAAIDGGGILVGNRVDLALEVSAVRTA